MRLIDADALKRIILSEGSYQNMVGVLEEEIDNAPTIDAEPVKHGKWVEKTVSDEKVIDEWQSARCSVCGKYHTTPYMYYFDNFTYCPNCGAKMKGQEE